MNEREKTIRLWFDMWLNQQDMGIDDIFTEDVIYTESWSPQYNNRKTVKHWFQEWNTRGKVVIWEIKQFFHKGDQTVVEWYFKNEMNNGDIEEFDGISLVEWTEDNKIKCALPGFVDSKNEEKTERNAGYLVVSHSGGGMLRQGTRKGIRRTPANRGMRAHWVVKGLDISEDVCHGMCP